MANMILTYLQENRQRLALSEQGIPRQLTSVMMTPRFRASSHVVYLIMPESKPEPVLVAKVPRLAGTAQTVIREVSNLQAVQASRPGGFDTIPRVVAFEQYENHQVLVETALVGRPISPEIVRQDPDRCCELVVDWLLEVQQPSFNKVYVETNWCERLVERPLIYLESSMPFNDWETHLMRQTRLLVANLCDADLPMVFEHGDLSHPNLFLLKDGRVGVVDWELAEPEGLVAYDLFFFLTYVAFARSNAQTASDYLTAFERAFFGPTAWAKPYVDMYARRFRLDADQLTALFVLCWARYLSNLLLRLEDNRPSDGRVASSTATWLRSNRYYALWQYTVNNAEQLVWNGPARAKTLKMMTQD